MYISKWSGKPEIELTTNELRVQQDSVVYFTTHPTTTFTKYSTVQVLVALDEVIGALRDYNEVSRVADDIVDLYRTDGVSLGKYIPARARAFMEAVWDIRYCNPDNVSLVPMPYSREAYNLPMWAELVAKLQRATAKLAKLINEYNTTVGIR